MQLATRKRNIRDYFFKIFTEKHKMAFEFRGYALNRFTQSLIACIMFRQAQTVHLHVLIY